MLKQKYVKRLKCACLTALLVLAPGWLAANPDGANIIRGDVVVTNADTGGVLSIKNSDGSIIEWQSFNISPDEVTRFLQSSPSSRVLNRIVGSQRSTQINGQLLSNGSVFLIDRNGIIVGNNGFIDVNGLVMSTLDISNADFLSNTLRFSDGNRNTGIINHGDVTSGQDIYLVGQRVINNGLISASGDILLTAGDSIFIETSGDDGLIAKSTGRGVVANNQRILSSSGLVGLLASSLGQQGTISADAVVVSDSGEISLTMDSGSSSGGDGSSSGSDGSSSGSSSSGSDSSGSSSSGSGSSGSSSSGSGTNDDSAVATTGETGTVTDSGGGDNANETSTADTIETTEALPPTVQLVLNANGATVSSSVKSSESTSIIADAESGVAEESNSDSDSDSRNGARLFNSGTLPGTNRKRKISVCQ